jgi:hypothetical protein
MCPIQFQANLLFLYFRDDFVMDATGFKIALILIDKTSYTFHPVRSMSHFFSKLIMM